MHRLLSHSARISRLQGSVIFAPLQTTFIGERCDIRNEQGEVIGAAQTVGFTEQGAVLSLIGSADRISRNCLVAPSGRAFDFAVGDALLGAIVDAHGAVRGRLLQDEAKQCVGGRIEVERAAPEFDQRRPVDRRFATGIRAIDGLLTTGVGQRVGIFAPAGGGKTSLMSMLIAHSDADVFVIGLVGERGREVAEFVAGGLPPDKTARTVLVFATSDRAPLERRNAALVATSIAEYFRDQGKHVLLLVDSMTRYARALRDVALSAGEAPARRGYPASVFEALPRLLERSGNTSQGAITAFYTVLLENDDQADPIGDEVRSILDGHLYLSQDLAARGHFPAIDVLRSASRVMSHVTNGEQRLWAACLRDKLARLAELQLVVDLGEYRPGENPDTDALFNTKPAIDAFLRQRLDESSTYDHTLAMLSQFR